ncbi:MAG TPA: cytochrome c biogenesis protein CcdA [Acidimicrobiales bacterium]|nr:cytochrome c biogenesis protein CcdA [Acidimicrobiales bacterium]HLH45789.1 cytochrome c biogenesis protein CcdA [Acidimicrobiales bacterium]
MLVLALGGGAAVPAAVTADPAGVLVAFGAGILSFVSPCVLPLVPGYVSMVTGLSAAELAAGPGQSPRRLAPLLRGIGLFIVGFTVVFVALGAAASGLGHALGTHKQQLTTAAGAVVVVLGLVLVASAAPLRASRLVGARGSGVLARVLGERRVHVRPSALGAWAAPVAGMAFAFAWTPCIGPVLGAVTALAATRATLAGGVVLLAAYSLGLGVPFLVTGLAFGRLTATLAGMRRGLWAVHAVGGVVLVAFGALLLAGQLGWLSSQVSTLLDHLGLHRLTTS